VIVFAGLFFDVVVYTIWLKRRTCWSILWGGLSGGMPILAGRALALGVIDWIGVMLALSVLFWIPTHILTFSLKHRTDYATAGIPTFPSTYGVQFTRATIVVSCILVALSIGLAAYGVGMTWGYLRMLIVLSAGLLTLAAGSILRPSERANFGLFKFASLYMLSSMLLIVMYGL
jgi:heme o synthase